MRKILLNVFAGDLAGGGSGTMFRESLPGFQKLAQDAGCELVTVSPGLTTGTNRNFCFTSDPINYRGRHREAANMATGMMKEFRGCDVRVFTWGYTSYIPHGFIKYIEAGEVRSFVWADSSPPDTITFNHDTASGRFFSGAYPSAAKMVLWCWHNYNAEHPELLARMPPGQKIIKTARPFGPQYLTRLRELRSMSTTGYRQVLGFTEVERVVVLASSDIWSPTAIGRWMTEQQWDNVRVKTLALLQSLDKAGQALHTNGQTLIVVADESISQVGYHPVNYSLLLKRFDPNQYRQLLKAANLVVTRTSNCVTAAECAFMGIPQYLTLMPACGYMNVETLAAEARGRGLLLPEVVISEAIFNYPTHALAVAAQNEAETFNREYNFFDTLGRLLLA